MKPLTEDVWLAELTRIEHTPVDGMTAREIMDKTGMSLTLVRNALRRGLATGRCVCVGRKPSIRIDGVNSTVPAYKILRKKKP